MPVKLTDKATQEMKALMQKEIQAKRIPPEATLRVMVVGGGCSGFTYKMGFDSKVNADDKVLEFDGVKVVVDGKSNLYLDGTEIDFQDGLMGRGFVFNNPNSSGTCGCGSSFSV